MEQTEGLVVAVIKDVVYDFSFGVSEISTLYAILTPRFLVTLRGKQLRTVELLRQAVDEFSAVLSDLHQLNERIKLIQEELGIRETESTNRSLFTLTLVSVVTVAALLLFRKKF